MDTGQFDALSRSRNAARSRRAAVARGLASLVALGGGMTVHAAEAKKKKCKKKKPKAPSCQATCHGACEFCFTRAAGPLLCGSISGGGAMPCNLPCFSDNDCVGTGLPYCITRLEDRETGDAQPRCSQPGGFCTAFDACGA